MEFRYRNYVVCMEEQEEKATITKCSRKLDYNAPILSTRRPNGATSSQFSRTTSRGTWHDTSNMVPFSWEQIPGKPKEVGKSDTLDLGVPPPKLLLSRWDRPNKMTKVRNGGQCHVDDDDEGEEQGEDEGCDGDVDDDGHDVFSDAIDMFSLGESSEWNGLGRINSDIDESRSTQSPSYIIQRFLSDATALAASSSAISKNLNKKLPQSSNYPGEASVSQPYPSPKSCGFDIFFPWWLKPKPCGLKSPVRQASIEAKSQWSARRKKQQQVSQN